MNIRELNRLDFSDPSGIIIYVTGNIKSTKDFAKGYNIIRKPLLTGFLITALVLTCGVKIFGATCWNLVWSDEFNGTSINTANWGYDTGCNAFGNSEWENYTNSSANSYVTGGNLVINAVQTGSGQCGFTSARLTTYNKVHFTYGRIEARIKAPYGQGIWPAFWMLGENINTSPWPACGELDIMEMIGGGSGKDNVNYGTAHWLNGSATQAGGSTSVPWPAKLSDAFHVYDIEWNATTITWYFDGTAYYTLDTTAAGMSAFQGKDFYILLNVAVGGTWPGYPDGTTVFPQQMLVDYVRWYQQGTCPDTPTFTPTCTRTSTLTSTATSTSTRTGTSTFTPTCTRTTTLTSTATSTSTRTGTLTPSASTTVSCTRTPTLTCTNTMVNTPAFTSTFTNTRTNTQSDTNTPTFTKTETLTFTRTCTQAITNTFTATPAITNTWSPTNTPAGSASVTATCTPGSSSTPSNTAISTPVNSATFTSTRTNTTVNTPTDTPQGTPSNTGTFTRTTTPGYSSTATASVSPQNTPTNTPANTAVNTPVNTVTNTYVITQTMLPTGTFTATSSDTAVNTATFTMTNTPTGTSTSTPTSTGTNTMTPGNTPTPANTAAPTPTISATPDKFEIKDPLVYPDPYDGSQPVYFSFNAAQACGDAILTIYTASFRMVLKVELGACEGGRDIKSVAAYHFSRLANGTYYYAITAKNYNEKSAVSKIQELIILR